MTTIIAYHRVSTKRQGQSGLGLEAQQDAVTAYATAHEGKILKEYVEVETGKGKNPNRPKLQEALTHAKRSGATLVIAKLDRLSRNVAFLSNLMEAGVEFVCCDNPHANKFTLHILAAVAEHEAKAISERTRHALAVVSKKGTKLGSSRPGHWDGNLNCTACHNHLIKRETCTKCNGTSAYRLNSKSELAKVYAHKELSRLKMSSCLVANLSAGTVAKSMLPKVMSRRNLTGLSVMRDGRNGTP
jgi:DNA invertase Pin-like site-specific DNA recombinase